MNKKQQPQITITNNKLKYQTGIPNIYKKLTHQTQKKIKRTNEIPKSYSEEKQMGEYTLARK